MTIFAELHDGRRLEFPDGTDDAVIQATVNRVLGKADAPSRGETWAHFALDPLKQTALGALRGAAGIGATLLAKPKPMGGEGLAAPMHRQEIDDALSTLMGADKKSGYFQGGKLAGEIAGTAGVGPALGGVAAGMGAAPSVARALTSAGLSTGGRGVKDALLRVGAGGVVGGTSAGAIDPSSAPVGALIGGALPPALAGAGAAGRMIGGAFRGSEKRALVDALELQDELARQVAAAKLRSAQTLVPGSAPTVAQVLRTPQAAILEGVVSDSAGGMVLKNVYQAQNAARIAALDKVAPIDPRGAQTAKEELGEALIRFAKGADKTAREATKKAYENVPMDEAALYLPDLGAVRDKYFGRGSVLGRGTVDDFVRTAREIGTEELEAIKPLKAGKSPRSLAQQIRREGGISAGDLGGEVRAAAKDLKGIKRNAGRTPDEMAERMREAGYLGDEGGDDLMQALRDEATGRPVYSTRDLPVDQWAAEREAAMGAPPGAQTLPKRVTLGEYENIRRDLGAAWKEAKRSPERAREAAALDEMRRAMDDHIEEVLRGDGAIDEALPIEWANDLTKARNLKREQAETFRTGPQKSIFRMGADGLPVVTGRDLIMKAMVSPADIGQLRKMIDAEPKLLGQFRSMLTTEGASTATNAEQLTGRFVRWVDNSLPKLKASFEPEQVKALERIAADIKRAEVAAGASKAGARKGSDTYMNAQNALRLGLLDSRVADVAAMKIPLGGLGLASVREATRTGRARALAGLLSDPNAAADALSGSYLLAPPWLTNLERGLLSVGPVLAAD